MNSDMEVLLRAARYESTATPAIEALLVVSRRNQIDAGVLAVEMNRLAEATRTAAETNVAPPKASAPSGAKEETSTTETVLKTVGMLTGVGPIVTSLYNLFGSSSPEPLPALERFQLPGSVSVEAGLSATREFSAIRYAQGGLPDTLAQPSGQSGPQPAIQVNIQAFDSQSFMDRQDDIARAVREAMLHSSPLNDIIQEI